MRHLFLVLNTKQSCRSYFTRINWDWKAHTNGRNIVGQQNATLLGVREPQQFWHLLALFAYSFKSVKLLGPCKRTKHCWPKASNNTQQCCDLLRPFAWALKIITLFSNKVALLTYPPFNCYTKTICSKNMFSWSYYKFQSSPYCMKPCWRFRSTPVSGSTLWMRRTEGEMSSTLWVVRGKQNNQLLHLKRKWNVYDSRIISQYILLYSLYRYFIKGSHSQ